MYKVMLVRVLIRYSTDHHVKIIIIEA